MLIFIGELFEDKISDEDLKSLSVQTDEILGAMGDRINILDQNQIKISFILKEAALQTKMHRLKDNLQEIKIHIKSIKILLVQRLSTLHRMVGEPDMMRSYLLSISLYESSDVVTMKYKTVGVRDIIGENISFSQFRHLFILVKILFHNQSRLINFFIN